jgi:DNA-binding SARP family transcriptional activator
MNAEIAIRAERGPVTFRLLGAFQIEASGRAQPTGPWQQQRLLIKLLAANGRPVANDQLMAAIWDEVPGPGATLEALRHLVGTARRTLAAAELTGVLRNANGMYRLEVQPAQVDVHVFRMLTGRARALARNGDRQAVGLLEEALRLCHGQPLAGVPGQWVNGYRYTLAEEIRAAQLTLYETALRHGESRERLPGLSTLLREQPEDELVAWLYMHALYRAGQPTRALEVKREFAAQLLEANGTKPGRALNELYQRILAEDDGLRAPEAIAFPGDEAGARARYRGSHDGPDEGPDEGPDREREEPGEPSADADGSAPRDQAARPRAEPAAAGVSYTFDTVYADHGHFGPTYNYGGSR